MTASRKMAWGSVAAALIVAVGWIVTPADGQPPAAPTAPLPPGYVQQPGSPPVPVAAPNAPPGGFGGGTFTYVAPGARDPFRVDQERKQVTDLAQQYLKATKEDEKKEVRKKLIELLGQQFDQLAERQQKELEELEKQVTALRTLLKKRHDNRDSIIDRRLEQVIQEAEGLGWGTHSAAPNAGYFTPVRP
jgi:hypothetical protein